jgi:hypothetical protein
MTSDKIRPHHLERKAILYVRQSSAHQGPNLGSIVSHMAATRLPARS